ncbi:DUF4112 domain-containing protein [uncultured Enterovirga sp.]|uniref:DUF4112 domain-containing protein n=1 Tax=uncultured Enterovirga sp. TaxID=2026352 RepID=UPI0035C96805
MAGPYSAFIERPIAASASRAETLARLDALSRLLDTAFVVPGTRIRFGVDGLIGLVPGVGDLISAALSTYLIWEARRLGLPVWKIGRMVANVVFDTAIGAVPILGDAADVLFKANRRNMRIIREHLEQHGGMAEPGVIDAEYRVVEPSR